MCVLEHMVKEWDNIPVTDTALLMPNGCRSPRSGVRQVPSAVPFLAQRVLAWLVRWDPHLKWIRPASHPVFLPLLALQSKGGFCFGL